MIDVQLWLSVTSDVPNKCDKRDFTSDVPNKCDKRDFKRIVVKPRFSQIAHPAILLFRV
jgi:hypothetical protein